MVNFKIRFCAEVISEDEACDVFQVSGSSIILCTNKRGSHFYIHMGSVYTDRPVSSRRIGPQPLRVLHMCLSHPGPGPEIIKLLSCSTQLSTTQLSMVYRMLIKTTMLKNIYFSSFQMLRC